MGRIKQAQFFSIDALIALTIIILTIITIAPIIRQVRQESSLPFDLIQTINSLKIGELDGVDLVALNITDPDKLVIEQIGEFYLTNPPVAEGLAEMILSSISPNENIGIWYGNQLLASRNITPFETAEDITIERQVISGIGGTAGVTGMSTRAYISSSARTDYFYFGGYVGEGNISSIIDYKGNISSAKIELVISDDFEVFVNGISTGNFLGSPDDFTPVSYDLPIGNFISGSNTIEFKGNILHLSGGFIKINYDSQVTYEQPIQYNFPGITGAINLYDGFHIPGNLTSLTISLHFNNSVETFLAIGDTIVFNDSTTGEETILLDNSSLSSLLNYNELSKKTIPIRLGMENTSYVTNNSRDIDVFSVTDLSGSMDASCEGSNWFCCWFSGDWCTSEATCSGCGGTLTNKIQDAKDANDLFIDMILNASSNRMGLVGYATSASVSNYHQLSSDDISLKSEVESWDAGGGTCICCGVNKGVSGLLADSTPDKFQSIVVMSDGEATVTCLEQGTGAPNTDAIQAACDAYNNHGIKVYTIGFGSSAGIQTLTDMASCGQGSFFATVDDLESIYEKIAEELIETAYFEQTIEISGDVLSRLFPDSYIEFEYQKAPEPTGLVLTIEEQFSSSSSGSFSIPENYTIVDANVISYSGPKWTSMVDINGNNIYNLTSYGTEYIKLGDPYSISIPPHLVQDSNTVNLGTGLSPTNVSEGSINNTIIYTVSKELESYNSVSAFADGCIWDVQFEGGNITLTIPSNYSGSTLCSYTSDDISCGLVDCQDSTDSVQLAIFNLLKNLDFNSDGIVDIELYEQDLQIEISTLEGIPFYHSTEVQVRKWY